MSSSRRRGFNRASNNPLSNLTSFASLGISFRQPGDNVIQTQNVSRDQRRIYTRTQPAAPQSPLKRREHTSLHPPSDFDIPADDSSSGWVDEDTVFESDQRLKKKKRDTL
ncbi:hypothetical protein MPER_00012, partial [Moniliophthora perniciosa FA553]